MRRFISFILMAVFLILCITPGCADESEGDLYVFCPFMCTSFYNSMLKSLLELNDSQASLLEVKYYETRDGTLIYANSKQDTIFIFGGTTNEYGSATSAYLYCSMKESSTLKNIPLLIWAAIIQNQYYGEIKETGDSFLEWVNGARKNGDTFTSQYFSARYQEEKDNYSSLLLIIK